METWFLNHVLGLSLSVLLLGLPGPLRAGTPNNSSTEPGTTGFYYSTITNEPGDMEYNETSTSHSSSESLSPSQRNLLLTHTAETHTATAGNFDTEQTQTFTETSSRSLETVRLSTEPLTSTLVAATTDSISSSSSSSSSSTSNSSSSSSDWRDPLHTDKLPDVSPVVSQKTMSSMATEDSSMPQDSPDSTLRMGDAVSSASQTAVLTDSTYTSTTISRAGERTLLSVTSSSNNSTSSAFTEDSNSHRSPSTWGVPATGGTETEGYTHSAPSTRTDSRDTTDQHITQSFGGIISETGSPGVSRGTQTLTGPPNATQHEHTSTSEGTSDSTPPLRVTEPSTDQSEVSVSSTTPVISPAGVPTKMSGTDQGSGSSVGSSTESSTGAFSSSTQNQEGTEGISSQTREKSVSFALTTAPPTVSSTTTNLDNSLTETPVLATDILLTTTVVTVTERSQITEEETFKATPSTTTTTTPLLPATSSSRISSTSSISTPGSPTQATVRYTTPSTTASTLGQQTSAVHSTHRLSPSQTQGPSTGVANPTNITTLQLDTSTGTLGVTTAHSQHITTTYTHSTPTRSTEALQTTRKQADRGTTAMVVTTSFADVRPTKTSPPPRDPCVSNPCMNGGMCVSSKGHQSTCHCQPAWTGPTCNDDVDECEENPCPADSRCVNTRGSFTCECPLGLDLEDGRTCTRAKTFLGTFSVNRLPHDPITFKSSTMHEVQREIIQLLNASLSVLRGYRRSTLSKKEENGVHILAVNMFSISTNVTIKEVNNSIQMSLSNCNSSVAHCRMVLHHQITYRVESLCSAQKIQCNPERSTCTDSSGTAQCQCLQGYYKHNPDDQSCLECGDGYKLENGTCVPCMFGFGGFNCGNFYKLIAVVVSPAGGVLLLILIIALIVTCCKRDKNDINKIIFKSGDLQMSPYADFPKNNRISMEWGRETIEMQENGSTKNLLQMTDIYYSPALRNSDLDRNGLYPFTGLPGSRHSCIYPAQWNPSFISDDSRRRDYF
ncbi:protein HEG [Thunnus maccoyii]|uniref:protein HEG n=1 Tax=Thunnus maccoyii TaxID=8240 RepID=UPI001C4B4F0E|nr:protein HEG [Thunnus maccoyii]